MQNTFKLNKFELNMKNTITCAHFYRGLLIIKHSFCELIFSFSPAASSALKLLFPITTTKLFSAMCKNNLFYFQAFKPLLAI